MWNWGRDGAYEEGAEEEEGPGGDEPGGLEAVGGVEEVGAEGEDAPEGGHGARSVGCFVRRRGLFRGCALWPLIVARLSRQRGDNARAIVRRWVLWNRSDEGVWVARVPFQGRFVCFCAAGGDVGAAVEWWCQESATRNMIGARCSVLYR